MASLLPQKLNCPAKIKMELTEDDDGPPVLDRMTPSPMDQSLLEPPPALRREVFQPGTSFVMPDLTGYLNPSPLAQSASDAFTERQTQLFFESINKSLQTQSSRIMPLLPNSALFSSLSLLQDMHRPPINTQPLPSCIYNQMTPPLKPVIGKKMPKPLAGKPKPPIPVPIALEKPNAPEKPNVPEKSSDNLSISISIKETGNSFLENFLAASFNKPRTPNKVSSALVRALKKRPAVKDEELPPSLIAATKLEPLAKRSKIDEDRPPSLEKVTVSRYCNTNNDDDTPPLLQREVPAVIMGVKEEAGDPETPVLVAADAPVLEAPVSVTPDAKNKNDVKKVPKITIKRISKTSKSEGPPILEMYTTQKAGPSYVGLSSGICSSADDDSKSSKVPLPLVSVENPPTACRRSERLQKGKAAQPPPNKPTPKRGATKRKASTTQNEVPAKKSRRRVKYLVPQPQEPDKCVLLDSFWLPRGRCYVDLVGTGRNHFVACCYTSVRHVSENVILRIGDAISVNAEGDDGENIGEIFKIYYDPNTGMRVEIHWYYHKHQCSILVGNKNEAKYLKNYEADQRELIYYGDHCDNISCDTIQTPVHVLTYREYNRYMAETKYDFLSDALQAQVNEFCSRGEDGFFRRKYLPHDDTPIELVYFTRKYYKCGGRSNPIRDMEFYTVNNLQLPRQHRRCR